jgi:hypothetical protein
MFGISGFHKKIRNRIMVHYVNTEEKTMDDFSKGLVRPLLEKFRKHCD